MNHQLPKSLSNIPVKYFFLRLSLFFTSTTCGLHDFLFSSRSTCPLCPSTSTRTSTACTASYHIHTWRHTETHRDTPRHRDQTQYCHSISSTPASRPYLASRHFISVCTCAREDTNRTRGRVRACGLRAFIACVASFMACYYPPYRSLTTRLK